MYIDCNYLLTIVIAKIQAKLFVIAFQIKKVQVRGEGYELLMYIFYLMFNHTKKNKARFSKMLILGLI